MDAITLTEVTYSWKSQPSLLVVALGFAVAGAAIAHRAHSDIDTRTRIYHRKRVEAVCSSHGGVFLRDSIVPRAVFQKCVR